RIDLQDRSYVALGTAYAGLFQPHASSPRANARIWTWAAVRVQELVVQAAIDCRVGSGELRDVIVHIRNWEGQEIRLEAPGVTSREERNSNSTDRVWRLHLPPENTGHFQITILAKRSLSSGRELLLPDIRVAGAAREERWVSVAERDFVVAETRGLQPIKGSAALSQPWPAGDLIRQTGDPVWRIEAEDWSARLRPRLYEGAQGRILVLLDEQAAAVVDNRHWLHQATYWLYQEGESALRLALPDGAVLVRAALDGKLVLLPYSDQTRHSLTLVDNDSPQVLRLWWRFKEEIERLE